MPDGKHVIFRGKINLSPCCYILFSSWKVYGHVFHLSLSDASRTVYRGNFLFRTVSALWSNLLSESTLTRRKFSLRPHYRGTVVDARPFPVTGVTHADAGRGRRISASRNATYVCFAPFKLRLVFFLNNQGLWIIY